MTRTHHIAEAMEWLKGALNCHLAAKVGGQEWIGTYVAGQVRDVKRHLEIARSLPCPRLP